MDKLGVDQPGEETRCIACCGRGRFELLRFAGVPISGRYLAKPDASLPRHNLVLRACAHCGLVVRDRLAMPDHDYSQIDRDTAQQMPDYAADLVAALERDGIVRADKVLEIGCNDGSFLAFLADSGFSKLTGIEPSVQLARRAAARGFAVATSYCSRAAAERIKAQYGTFKAVICRHTLEHVPDAEDLLSAIGALLEPGGVCLIEVPDFEWVTETLAVHEIWDEHISYFSAPNLQMLHQRLGFVPIACRQMRFRDTRNLVMSSRWTGQDTPIAAATYTAAAETVERCQSLAQAWPAYVTRLAAASVRWSHPVIAIGASHIQGNYVHFAGLAGIVDALVDDAPEKAGTFVMLDRPRPVLSTKTILATVDAGTLLRTAFPYPGWMDSIAEALLPRGVNIVDPYSADLVGPVRTHRVGA